MEQQQKQSGASVEEVERRSSQCSPVVCILSVCLCLVLVALIVVTGLHTHTKLQEADSGAGSNSFSCPAMADLPANPVQKSRLFSVIVGTGDGGGGGGGACTEWFAYACPREGSSARREENVTYSQMVLLSLAKSACTRGQEVVDSLLRTFFNVTSVKADLFKPAFKC